jgi:aspartyl-tRNA(Asn)/glutamyl-tRNA(Gln) amidotransferase subunit A
MPDARGLRVGVVPAHFGEGIEPAVAASVRAAITALKDAGAEIVDLSMPMSEFGIQIYYILATSEASSNLSRFDGVRFGDRLGGGKLAELYAHTRGRGFGPEVKRRIMLGTYALSSGYQDAYYKRAMAAKQALVREYTECFAKCDVIIGPTSPQAAFPLGANLADPLAMYLCDLYTIGANLTGVPAVSVPCGTTPSGLPVGVHLQGPAGQDWKLLAVAELVERLVGYGAKVATPMV